MKMPDIMIEDHDPCARPYSATDGARRALEALKCLAASQLPPEVRGHLDNVVFSAYYADNGTYFPCPFKETEAAAALKAVEASAVAAIADVRYGCQKRKLDVNLERTAAFLLSTYIATIGGLRKGDPDVRAKLKGAAAPF